MRSAVFHPLLLYPLLAALAALAVLVSLRPAWPVAQTPPQSAQREGPAFDFTAPALAAVQPGAAHVAFITRSGETPTALRLGRTMESVGQDAPGALLPLTAADAEAFVNQITIAEVRYRPLFITRAEGLSVRWAGAGDGAWQSFAAPPTEGRAVFTLPAPATAPTALEIRIDSTKNDYTYGLELVWVRLTPGGTAPAAEPTAP